MIILVLRYKLLLAFLLLVKMQSIVLYSSIYIAPLNSHGQTKVLLVRLAPRKKTSFKKW